MATVPGQAGRRGRAALAILALVIAAGVGTFGSSSSTASKAALGNASPRAAVPGAAAPRQTSTSGSTTTTTTLPPLVVLKVTPANKAKEVGPSTPVVVTYNRAPGPATPHPTISPSTPGYWAQAETGRLVFKPTGYWEPGTTYRVFIPVPGGAPAAASTVVKFSTALPPLAVLKVTPANKAKAVGPSTPVVVTYNRAPGPATPHPTISPSTPGYWARAGTDRLVFRPTGYWGPGTTYRVSIPVAGGAPAAASTVVKFSTALPSLLALQQYLAMLGYLPLRFTPTGDIPNRKAVLQREPTSPNLVPQVPAAGVFTWSYPDIPSSLWAQWHRAQPNVVTTGAVMQFEVAQGLVPDGDAGPPVWDALLKAVAKRQMNTSPYDYVIASESSPETLYVWQDGKFVYHTLTNTGVPGAATPQGTWPVDYNQNPNLMKGCDVNGYCYSVWVAYASYFLPSVGDAIHAYTRYSYGYPQSNGCVEVEPSQGAVMYGYDPVGTLVTVSSWVGPAQQS